MAIRKNFIIKLPYNERTEALGFLADNERWDTKKDKAVAANNIRLPPINTAWSIPYLSNILFPARKKPFNKMNNNNKGR